MALQKKPPVVTVMGHVDHGKTSLLDYIRKTKLVSKEAGEITQAIGAYQVEVQGQKVTFIDTPGHEAFMKMRQRGALAADLVILVVAANDGVQPQTKESIRIIKEAGVPFIVAINKIDLPEASIDKVKAQLAENEVFVEGYGGKEVVIPISAKTGQGVDSLLEMILLTSEMSEIKADSSAPLEAVVIESKFDKLCGVTATLIIKNGTLKKSDSFWIDNLSSKARMLKDSFGKLINEALPGDPVLVLGFEELPKVGSILTASAVQTEEAVKVENQEVPDKGLKLKIILKTDVSGSLEAILSCLSKDVEVLEKSVGEIKESDVLLAKTLGAEIFGFNVNLPAVVEKLAEEEKIKVKTYRVIYDLLQDIEKKLTRLLKPEDNRNILGKAEILQVFEMKGQKIAGSKVLEGKINKNFPVMIKRGEETLSDTKVLSLKEKKQDINEAITGTEFGAVFISKLDFNPGDMIISYSLEEN